MNILNKEELKALEFEQNRRHFLNGMFWLLKGLTVHDAKNEAMAKPFENFSKAFQELLVYSKNTRAVELRFEEGLITVMGMKYKAHYSIVEATKSVADCLEVAMIETLTFDHKLTQEGIAEFFKKWALHCAVHQRPKAIPVSVPGIKITHIDPEKANLRLKNKQLLMDPLYALQHYFLLRKYLQEFYIGLKKNRLVSQKKLRKEIIEMIEIARVEPYNLVSLALIRYEEGNQTTSVPLSQALATSLLILVVGQAFQFSVRDLANLGLVGLMYNVGLLTEEANTVLKNDRLTPEEYARVLRAQAGGVVTLIQLQGTSRPVLERLMAIYEHAQSGKTQSISLALEGWILRVTSEYVALTSSRPFRDAYTPHEALKILGHKMMTMKEEATFAPLVYYMLVRTLGLWPVGSFVQLSNEQKGIVFRPTGEQTGLPLIKLVNVAYTSALDEINASILDLGQNPSIRIEKELDPQVEGIGVIGHFMPRI